MSYGVVCEANNATVASICCAQLGVPLTMGSTTVTIVPQSTPIPTGIPSTTCEWNASSSSHTAQIESWLSCTGQYPNSTVNVTACLWPVLLSSAAHSAKIKGPVKYIHVLVLVGAIVQTMLTIR